MPREIVLHQFPISHYCEKIRWVLDHKRLRYRVKNLMPGVHLLVNQRLVGRGSVPVLVDGGHAVGDSSDIALYLDDQYPEHQLIPSEPAERKEVLALEAYFDEHAGPAIRRYVYAFVLRDTALFRRIFLPGYSALERTVLTLVARPLADGIASSYRVSERGKREALAATERAFDRLEELLAASSGPYLVGDRLTLADVTAASLLAPLLTPSGSPWAGFDPDIRELREQRDALRARPGGRWVAARYAEDRWAPA